MPVSLVSCPHCEAENFLSVEPSTRELNVNCSSCHAELGRLIDLNPSVVEQSDDNDA